MTVLFNLCWLLMSFCGERYCFWLFTRFIGVMVTNLAVAQFHDIIFA